MTNRERAERTAREFVDSLHFMAPTQAAAQAIVETHVRNLADIIERAGEGDGRCSCFIPVGYRDIKCPQHGDNKGSSAEKEKD